MFTVLFRLVRIAFIFISTFKYSLKLFQARMAIRYGMFRICVLRTSHLEPHRTSVQFLKRTVPTYRTRTTTKKAYRTSWQKLRRTALYLRTVLAFLILTTRNFN